MADLVTLVWRRKGLARMVHPAEAVCHMNFEILDSSVEAVSVRPS